MQVIITYIGCFLFIVLGFNILKIIINIIRVPGYLAFQVKREIKRNFGNESIVIKDEQLIKFQKEYISSHKDIVDNFAEPMLLNLIERYNFHKKSLTIRNERYSSWNFWINTSLVVSTPLLLLVLSFEDNVFSHINIPFEDNIFSNNNIPFLQCDQSVDKKTL